MSKNNYQKRKNVVSELGDGFTADIFLDCLREVIENPKYKEIKQKAKEAKKRKSRKRQTPEKNNL